MNYILALVVGVVLLASQTHADGICLNPLFGRCSNSFFCTVPFLPAPISKPDTRICPDIPAGQSSCCNQAVYNSITTAFAIGRAEVQAAVDNFAQVRSVLKIILDEFQAIINNISNNYPQLSEQQRSDLKSAYQSILDATETYIDSAVGDWAQCARGLLNYWAGLMCFGCNPNWNVYIRQNNVTDRVTVILDTTTCTDLTGACQPFFQDISNYANTVITAVQKIVSIVLTGSEGKGIAPMNGAKDVCQGDCPKYICYTFIVGFSYRNPTVGDWESESEDSEGDGHGPNPSNERKRVTASESMKGMVESLMNDSEMNKGFGTRFVKIMERLEKAVTDLHKTNEKVTRSFYQRESGGVDNNFQSGGYQATKVGQSSGLDTSVNGAASSISSWMNWLL